MNGSDAEAAVSAPLSQRTKDLLLLTEAAAQLGVPLRSDPMADFAPFDRSTVVDVSSDVCLAPPLEVQHDAPPGVVRRHVEDQRCPPGRVALPPPGHAVPIDVAAIYDAVEAGCDPHRIAAALVALSRRPPNGPASGQTTNTS